LWKSWVVRINSSFENPIVDAKVLEEEEEEKGGGGGREGEGRGRRTRKGEDSSSV